MCHAWLIESLAELRDHATETGLMRLAEHLDEAIDLAHLEIAAQLDHERYAPPCPRQDDALLVNRE